MSSPLLTIDGSFDRQSELTVERLLDHLGVDPHGRRRLSIIDLLAHLRVGAEAEILFVEFATGASRAWRLRAILGDDDAHLRLVGPQPADGVTARWEARLWTTDLGLTEQVASIAAIPFASFVGSS